jgi:hypothetical protein
MHGIAFMTANGVVRMQGGGDMQHTENKWLDKRLTHKILGISEFLRVGDTELLRFRGEVMFLNLEMSDFPIQCRRRNSEFRSRALWPSNLSFALGQSSFNNFSFLILESVRQRT